MFFEIFIKFNVINYYNKYEEIDKTRSNFLTQKEFI